MGFLLFASADGPVTQDLSVFSPASPPVESTRGLFVLVLAVTSAAVSGTPRPM
jgi:hypothetical protein